MICNQCPRRCNAERGETIGSGFCKMPEKPVLARAGLHFWEEPCISGSRGSGTIFFSGCSLRCAFCQNSDISRGGKGKAVSFERLAEIFKELESSGAHNINLVTPTHYHHAVKQALNIYRPNIPIVCNSSGYELCDAFDFGLYDIYLIDLKYINEESSALYSCAVDYFDHASKFILKAYERVGAPRFDKNGILLRGVIIRHLLIPSHTNDAIKIIDWVEKNCPNVIFSLMGQYMPLGVDKYPKINRKVTKREYEKVLCHLESCNLKHAYSQELSSANNEFIPDFDFSGI